MGQLEISECDWPKNIFHFQAMKHKPLISLIYTGQIHMYVNEHTYNRLGLPKQIFSLAFLELPGSFIDSVYQCQLSETTGHNKDL